MEKSSLIFYVVQWKEQVMLRNGMRAEKVGLCMPSVVAPSVAFGLTWMWRSDWSNYLKKTNPLNSKWKNNFLIPGWTANTILTGKLASVLQQRQQACTSQKSKIVPLWSSEGSLMSPYKPEILQTLSVWKQTNLPYFPLYQESVISYHLSPIPACLIKKQLSFQDRPIIMPYQYLSLFSFSLFIFYFFDRLSLWFSINTSSDEWG